jgi:hypothetical protein
MSKRGACLKKCLGDRERWRKKERKIETKKEKRESKWERGRIR